MEFCGLQKPEDPDFRIRDAQEMTADFGNLNTNIAAKKRDSPFF